MTSGANKHSPQLFSYNPAEKCSYAGSALPTRHPGRRGGGIKRLRAAAAAKPLSQIASQTQWRGVPDVDAKTLAVVSRLTGLTRLVLRNGTGDFSLGLHEFLGFLTGLKDLELENWWTDEPDDDGHFFHVLGRTLPGLTSFTRLVLSDSLNGSIGMVHPDLFPSFLAWVVELSAAENEIGFEEAAILSRLPRLRDLTAICVYICQTLMILCSDRYSGCACLKVYSCCGSRALLTMHAHFPVPALRVYSQHLSDDRCYLLCLSCKAPHLRDIGFSRAAQQRLPTLLAITD